MLSKKNLSPQQLAAFTAAALSVPIALGILLITLNWIVALVSLVLIFSGSYGLILYTLERFIYSKIKLIYKLIQQKKATRKEETYRKYVLPRKSIEEVRQDVEEWANSQHQELELLRKNESYRRDFLQNLAHEFKTPVFAIQGYVDTLLDGAMDDETILRKFLENTARNADRLVNLVNDMDEISQLESGEQLLYPRNFVIQDLIKETFELLSIKTSQKSIKCALKKGCETPVTVNADKEKIKQVLINLIENATKYGKLNGNITASVYKTDDRNVLIEISDDGTGIEEEHIPRIFERFYRTDAARSRDKGGSGLGLAICKHIIEAHGHHIHVRSRIDIGTTIGFTLPGKKDSKADIN
jgi:two-component system, OmpR family, phosphate regulon sensor histidine kinase PhoR